MNYLGAKVKKQQVDGHFDVIQVELNGQQTTMYFDITIPLKAMAAELDGSKK
jgi:hypothetical protein